MRISTAQIFRQGLQALQQQQAKVQQTQLQLSTGKRINKPSDDPSAAGKIVNLKSNLQVIDQFDRNIAVAQSSLALEESIMTSVGNSIQRLRELAIQGNNSTYSDADKRSIAQEMYQRLDELTALSNTRDASGQYIFGGFKVDSPPFVNVGGNIQYQGDQGQRQIQIGEASRVSLGDTGEKVFLRIPSGDGNIELEANPANTGNARTGAFGTTGSFVEDEYTVTFIQASPTDPITYDVVGNTTGAVVTGATYTEGESIAFQGAQFSISGTPAAGDSIELRPSTNRDLFSTIQGIADALSRPAVNEAEIARFHNDMNAGIANLDQALDNISSVRAGIGSRLNNIEAVEEINLDFKLQLNTVLSETQDLDFAEAISRFNLQLTSLQAAQQAFVQTSNLSLFNLL